MAAIQNNHMTQLRLLTRNQNEGAQLSSGGQASIRLATPHSFVNVIGELISFMIDRSNTQDDSDAGHNLPTN